MFFRKKKIKYFFRFQFARCSSSCGFEKQWNKILFSKTFCRMQMFTKTTKLIMKYFEKRLNKFKYFSTLKAPHIVLLQISITPNKLFAISVALIALFGN